MLAAGLSLALVSLMMLALWALSSFIYARSLHHCSGSTGVDSGAFRKSLRPYQVKLKACADLKCE